MGVVNIRTGKLNLGTGAVIPLRHWHLLRSPGSQVGSQYSIIDLPISFGVHPSATTGRKGHNPIHLILSVITVTGRYLYFCGAVVVKALIKGSTPSTYQKSRHLFIVSA